MSKTLGSSDMTSWYLLSHRSTAQSTDLPKRRRRIQAGRVEHSGLEPKSYSMTILADLSTEQIEEIGHKSDQHILPRISDLENQVNILQSQVDILQNQVNVLQNQVEMLTQKEEVIDLKINWSHVRAVVEAASFKLNWNIKISAHYGLQGAVPRMPLMRPSRSALPLFLMLCTNSKKPRYSGSFSCEIPRCGLNQERNKDQKPSMVLTCTSQKPS